MAKLNLVHEVNQVLTGKDGVVIQKYIAGIPAGRVLDTTGYTAETIPAGLVVTTDGNGNYKPLTISGTGYGSAAAGFSICGIVACTVLTSKPAVSIMISGVVNEAALPYAVTDTIKNALPNIMFIKDETGEDESDESDESD